MSTNYQPEHPQQIYTPGWHYEAQTPVVDNKYYDRTTGELRTASGHDEFQGPPAVDIVIQSLHADTTHCVYRAALPFPMESLLCQVAKVIGDRKLKVDSLNATPFAIRIILSHELDPDQFYEIAGDMSQGIWRQK